jgi:hypothetical protein
MVAPAALLEQALAAHGDTLYRLALLAAGDEPAAEALLQALAAERLATWREAPPPAAPGEPELLTALAAAARAAEAKPARPSRRARRPLAFGPFPIARLPLDQRLALGLHLLLGYDGPRIAAVLGGAPEQARALLVAAVRALGPAAGHSLTDRVSGEQCQPVREALVDPTAGSRQGAAVRGHLAACSLCRSFDHDWGEITHRVEDAVRATLRERELPPALAARLLAAAKPRRRAGPSLWLAVPPLAVLALIAALVLPGFLRAPVSVVQREAGETTDPRELIALGLKRHTAPPDRGGIWYARFRTEWFFDEGVYAPLTAEIWLDPRSTARHRLQLTHADGGAPYEMQLGNGYDRLYYALDAAYAPALYGGLATAARLDEPALVAERLDGAGQRRALEERLASGPWSIPPSYLRQAEAAADLRVLGRQRDGERTVEILSFSGVSPLGLPPDAPGATAQRVTVLLALDVEDGLLRSATELAGPAGSEQVSRVTWRVEDEQWLSASAQIDGAFNIGRAWTGMGAFSERGRHRSADLALPLISARFVADPARLLRSDLVINAFWMPGGPPAGVDRALLIWPNVDVNRGASPVGLVYLGPGRRLLIAFNRTRPVEGEGLREGVWEGTLRPGPTGRYTLVLRREPQDGIVTAAGGVDPSANITVDAYGFSRDELLALVRDLRPFDLDALAAQDRLFVGRGGDPQARALLLQVAQEGAAVPEGRARFVRALSYSRQAPPREDQRRDPYHAQPYDGQPETTRVEEWAARNEGPALYTDAGAADGGTTYSRAYIDPAEGWYYRAVPDVALGYSTRYTPPLTMLPRFTQAAVEMLTVAGEGPTLAERPGGGTLISRSEQAESSPRYGYLLNVASGGSPYLFDIRPISITTELALGPAGEPDEVAVYAVDAGGARTLVERYEVQERGEVPLAEAPAALREGDMPPATYTSDYRGVDNWSPAALVTRTLTEALALHAGDVYVLDGAKLLYVEGGPLDDRAPAYGTFLEPAIGQRLALRLSYAVPPPETGGRGTEIKLTQGPAEPLRALLRSTPDTPWQASEPVRLRAAGREVEAWLGTGERDYLLFELDGALIAVEAPAGWYRSGGAAILERLRLAAGGRR